MFLDCINYNNKIDIDINIETDNEVIDSENITIKETQE